ncbi:hypothetical protein AYI69_g9944 [Smittium culicis]|uniref:Uncharacterized protein n=1 Tax=Smittium culicis TaxID=133412 RepID=A0A1R1X977_9FUNG|nr:hypothetical protein AYI69_g9944 [Smittium culicis]
MSEGHSVLFDHDSFNQQQTDYGFQNGGSDGLDFYQSNYQNTFNPGGGVNGAIPAAGADYSQSTGDFSLNGFSEGPRIVEISWLAAFGTGGFPNEPPLLEDVSSS